MLHRFQPHAVSVALDSHGDLWLAFADARLTRFRIEHTANRASGLLPAAEFIPHRDFPGGYPVPFVVDNSDQVWYALGERIATLVDGEMNARTYGVECDASNLASGVYLCHIRAGAFTETRRLMPVK